MYSSTLSLTSVLDGGGWLTAHPGRFIPEKDTGADVDGCGKSRPPPAFDPRNVHSEASRYTDWAIPAHDWIQETDL
jgi:hypothetical protein